MALTTVRLGHGSGSGLNQLLDEIVFSVFGESKEPVVSGSMRLVNAKKGSFINSDGFYKIEKIIPGIYSLSFSSVGCPDTTFSDIEVLKDSIVEVNLEIYFPPC